MTAPAAALFLVSQWIAQKSASPAPAGPTGAAETAGMASGAPAVGQGLPAPRMLEFGHRPFPAYLPAQPDPERVVLLLADRPEEAGTLAVPLQAAGALVVVVDVPRYLADSAAHGKACAVADVDFEALGKVSQKLLGLKHYHPASLLGVGKTAAALAYVVLAQAPPGTFTNAVSSEFCPRLAVAKPLCRERGLVDQTARLEASVDGAPLEPARKLVMPWTVVSVGQCEEPAVAAFAAGVPTAEVAFASPGGPPEIDRVSAGLARTESAGGRGSVTATDPAVRDLPLREVVSAPQPGKGPADLLAVMVSGDGGWTGFDRQLGRALADHGVPVVGIDSLRYFWTPRSPEETGADLRRIVETYLPAWNKTKVLLIGYSQGADIVPFMVDALPPEVRQRVALTVMIGPDGSADFGLDLEGWTTEGDPRPELAVLPAVESMRGVPALCVFGAQEKGSLCPRLERSAVRLLKVPEAGHFFGQQEELILTSILNAVGEPLAALPAKPQHPGHPHHRRQHPGEETHATP